jgi:hypothetical protein
VITPDPLNEHTVDFTNLSGQGAIVNVTTTANTTAKVGFPGSGLALASVVTAVFVVSGLVLIPGGSLRRLRQCVSGTGLLCALLMFPHCGGGTSNGGGGGGGNGTVPGDYKVTINAYTVSNANGTPDSSAIISVKVN